jgi:outer membrane protein OmpA-like peptidoglycan-associated protein
MKAKIFFPLLFPCMLSCLTAIAAHDTVSIYFPFNKSTLTEEASLRLDSSIYKRTISEEYRLKIIGYTDEVGGDQYNLQLSKDRAASVKAYLIQSGFRDDHIILITGKGETAAQAATGPDGNPADRRVDIVVDKVVHKAHIPTTAPPATIVMSQQSAGPARKASVTDFNTVAPGEALVLDKIYFYPGRHIARKESDEALNALYESLKANPTVRINIEGHVCCVPASEPDAIDDDTFRKELSVNRARTIREYLIKRGIEHTRIKYEGFGHRKPVITPETTEEEANQNRRVEIRIIP